MRDNLNEKTRFSFVVSKKDINKATKRNYLKRRGRYIIRKQKNINSGYKCVLHFKKKAEKTNFNTLNRYIINIIKKIGIIETK